MGAFSIEGIWVWCIMLVMLLICIICLVRIRRHQQINQQTGHAYTPFYIQDGRFIVNNAPQTTYALSEIARVIVGVDKSISGPYRSGGAGGYFRVVRMDGKASLKFQFDGSVYTHKTQLFSQTNQDLLESVKLIEGWLDEAGIPYTVAGKEKLE